MVDFRSTNCDMRIATYCVRIAAAAKQRRVQETPTERAERIWRALDVDNSGGVDKDELFAHLTSTARMDEATAERATGPRRTFHEEYGWWR